MIKGLFDRYPCNAVSGKLTVHSGQSQVQAARAANRLATPARAACARAGREHALRWELQRALAQSFASRLPQAAGERRDCRLTGGASRHPRG